MAPLPGEQELTRNAWFYASSPRHHWLKLVRLDFRWFVFIRDRTPIESDEGGKQMANENRAKWAPFISMAPTNFHATAGCRAGENGGFLVYFEWEPKFPRKLLLLRWRSRECFLMASWSALLFGEAPDSSRCRVSISNETIGFRARLKNKRKRQKS